MTRFTYYEPQTLSEASAILVRDGDRAAILAGGTDLLLQIRRRARQPKSVVNIKAISALHGLEYHATDGLRIGALTTFRQLETDANVAAIYPALSEAAKVVAGVQVRNLATVGGNLGNASPSADSVPPLVALNSTVLIDGVGGQRELPITDCIVGPGQTALMPGEFFVAIQVPNVPAASGNTYERLTPRAAMDIAIVSSAAFIALDHNGRCLDSRIALGAVTPVPFRAQLAETSMRGEALTPALLERVGELAAEAVHPISDIRGSADYRRAMVAALTRRTVARAWRRANGGADPLDDSVSTPSPGAI